MSTASRVNKTARKPLNLKAVAKILGVSTATVSNAFNRPNQLSASLREKILKECDELGYHGPNLAARSLRKGQSDVIAVVLADSLGYSFSDPVASQFLQGVSEVLAEHSKQLLLLSSKFTGKEQSSAESLPDGFIFYGTPSGDCFERIYKFGKKVVAVDFESHARAMGANAETVHSIADLKEAFDRARQSDRTYVISLKVDAFEGWTQEGHAWWEVGPEPWCRP